MKMIPLPIKEGLGVVDRHRGAGADHPLPPPPLRRGVIFMAAKDPRSSSWVAELKKQLRRSFAALT